MYPQRAARDPGCERSLPESGGARAAWSRRTERPTLGDCRQRPSASSAVSAGGDSTVKMIRGATTQWHHRVGSSCLK